ncbi:MAG: DUF2569 family protein [Bacteroidetes bacterium]|nr:DUF2569 family protein [Bacteroidota bacterium]
MSFIFSDSFAQFLVSFINKVTNDSGAEKLNFGLIISSILAAAIFTFVFLKLSKRKVSYKHYDPDEYPAKLKKFSGLLLLVVPVIIFELIKNFYHLYSYKFLFYGKVDFFLSSLEQPGLQLWWKTLIYFIVITSTFKIIFSLFNIFFLFKRKRIFRFSIIAYTIAAILTEGLKYFFVTQVIEPNTEIIYIVFSQWNELIYFSVVLSAYILISRRVNAVFSN